MRYKITILFLFCISSESVIAGAPIDCAHRSLAAAVNTGRVKSISFTGVCSGPILIHTDGLSLIGVGTAVIDGGGQDAVTVDGAHGVALRNVEIRNGRTGLRGTNGAHITLTDVNAHDNRASGISLLTASSAALSGVTASDNGLHGLDLETGSVATLTGDFAATGNRVFGINVNGSSMTFTQATANVSGNVLGVQIATGANAFINDPATTLNVDNNFATGLTIVSGAHMVSFGGKIHATGNGVNGVSLNSKAGLDLDAGALLTCSGNNAAGLLLQENSVMTVFNIPQFSQVPGTSTVECEGNELDGITLRSGSTLTLSNQAKIVSNQNGAHGLAADNGAGVTLVNSLITGNRTKDIQLTFGSRADIQATSFGTASCDATVLIRGTGGINCPQ